MNRDEAVAKVADRLAAMDHAQIFRVVRHLEGEHLAALVRTVRNVVAEDLAAEILLVDREGQ